jgi:hypothetical protein
VTSTHGFSGEFTAPRVEIHEEAFKTREEADRHASFIESQSRFGCLTTIIKMPIR